MARAGAKAAVPREAAMVAAARVAATRWRRRGGATMVVAAMVVAMAAAARVATATVWLAEGSWVAASATACAAAQIPPACLVRVRAWESEGEG